MAHVLLRLESLRARHAELDEEIRKEMARPLPDELKIRSLKRQKLQVKDLIMLGTSNNPVQSTAWHEPGAAGAMQHH